MKKKQVTKLFAVMTMAASPAAANPEAQPDPWAVTATVSPRTPQERSHAMAAVLTIGVAAFGRPREMPTGAPAVGNVTSRAMAAERPLPPPVIAAQPRSMPSGAPACGNVASRAPRPADCPPRGPSIMAGTPPPAPITAAATPPRSATPRVVRPTAPTTDGAQ